MFRAYYVHLTGHFLMVLGRGAALTRLTLPTVTHPPQRQAPSGRAWPYVLPQYGRHTSKGTPALVEGGMTACVEMGHVPQYRPPDYFNKASSQVVADHSLIPTAC